MPTGPLPDEPHTSPWFLWDHTRYRSLRLDLARSVFSVDLMASVRLRESHRSGTRIGLRLRLIATARTATATTRDG